MVTRHDEAIEICREMARVRYDLDEDVGQLFDNVRVLTDWRYYVKMHPWACIGAAAALGYLAVPKKVQIISPDAATLEKLADKDRLVVKRKPKAEAGSSLTGTMFSLLANMVMRGGIAYIGQQLGKVAGHQAAEQPAGEVPQT